MVSRCLMMTVHLLLVLLLSASIRHVRGANSEILQARQYNQLIRGVRIQRQGEITRQLVEPPRGFSSYEYQFDVNVVASASEAPTAGTTDEKASSLELTSSPTAATIIYSGEGVFLPAPEDGVRQDEEEEGGMEDEMDQKEDNQDEDDQDTGNNREPTNPNDLTTSEPAEQAVENAQQGEEETPTTDPIVQDEDETDNFLPALAEEDEETAETAGKPEYYYVDLRPFSVFVETTKDLSMDLGIPLYLLLEMGETLGNLVDVKISNLTIQMGVIMNDHHDHNDDNQHHTVRRARSLQDSDNSPDHLHWNQLFFQGKAQFEDSVVYPTVTVQNVQSLVLSNEASLQEFWDNQGMGATYQHLELKNITLLPLPGESTAAPSEPEVATPSPTVIEPTPTQAPSVMQTEIVEYPDAETERSSNVWVVVALMLVFLCICFCIIGLCGRLQYLSSRAQDRYNEKYGLDYNVYDKDIGREIFKEEYLMSEHAGQDFSHNSGGLSDSLKSFEGFLARRSSHTKIKTPTNDEISTEEEEEDTTQGSPVGNGEVKSVTPNNSQTRHNGSFMPSPVMQGSSRSMQGSSRSMEAPAAEERNGLAALTDDDDSDQPPEQFVDEFTDNEGLAPPAVPRETASIAPIAPSETMPVLKSIPVRRAEPRQMPLPDEIPSSENIPANSIPTRSDPPESIPVKPMPAKSAPYEDINSIPDKWTAEAGEANLLGLPDFKAPPTSAPMPAPMSPRMEQSKPEFENHDHVQSTPTKDNRTNVIDMVDTVPTIAVESGTRSTGSSISSFKRRGSKGDAGNSSLRGHSSRSQGSYSAHGDAPGVLLGNNSGRDRSERSTRSNRSIKSISSASSMGSFYSCQGDLV